MNETQPSLSGETDDLKVARFYALGGAGMHRWLGVTPGIPHPNPEELSQTAKDTEVYLLGRPTGPWDSPHPDEHYETTLGETSLKAKTARLLVDEWAEAELRDDRTATNDIFEELTERAVRRAKLIKRRRAIVRDHDAAFTMNALYDRKERIKARHAPGPPPEPEEKPSPPSVAEGGREEEPETEPEERPPPPPPAPPPASTPPIIPAQKSQAHEAPPPSYKMSLAAPSPDEELLAEGPPAKRQNILSKVWWATGGAVGAWLSHPEKGKRRQTMVTLGMYATAAGLAWMLGNPPNEQDAPTATPPHAPEFDQSFTDSLQPADYEGQKYEWGAAADDYGAAEATPRLLDMIDDARAQGARVDTWGDVSSGRWGISNVTVYFEDGSHKSYFDTPRKLALLQYLAKLNRLEDDEFSPG